MLAKAPKNGNPKSRRVVEDKTFLTPLAMVFVLRTAFSETELNSLIVEFNCSLRDNPF